MDSVIMLGNTGKESQQQLHKMILNELLKGKREMDRKSNENSSQREENKYSHGDVKLQSMF